MVTSHQAKLAIRGVLLLKHLLKANAAHLLPPPQMILQLGMPLLARSTVRRGFLGVVRVDSKALADLWGRGGTNLKYVGFANGCKLLHPRTGGWCLRSCRIGGFAACAPAIYRSSQDDGKQAFQITMNL